MPRLKAGFKPVALVTGGASSLGSVISRTLAKAGFDLILHYGKSLQPTLELQKRLRGEGFESLLIQADLGRPESLSNLARRAPRHFARLGLLVNNASLFEPTAVFNAKDWRRILSVNLLSPYAFGEAARPFLAKNQGNIVNITDIYGEHPLLRDHSAYCLSKGALITATKFMAAQWSPLVRVNAVSPGVISFPAHYGAGKKKKLIAKAALKRSGSPEDIAQAVLFLARNSFITGEVLKVDGGRFL